ncbi:thioredoxin family protein [bacterium]|nr:thioredoxin family protein [bacterium]
MKVKRAFAFILFVVIVIAVIFLATKGGRKEKVSEGVSNQIANIPITNNQPSFTSQAKKEVSDILVELDTGNFSKFINSQIPVVVDFWATTCSACRMLEPVLREVAKELNGEMKFGKIAIDIGNNEEVARRFSIIGTPTLIVFRGGKELGQIVGYRGKEELMDSLKAFLVKK